MNQNKNTVTEFFNSKAKLLNEMPSAKTWSAIQSRLVRKHKRTKLIKVLNVTLAVAASALIAVNVIWISHGLAKANQEIEMVSLDAFIPSPWSVYNESPLPQTVNETQTIPNQKREFINKSPKEVMSSKWKYIDNSAKELDNMSAISGSWILPSWLEMDKNLHIPSKIDVFHTNDDRYYLHLNKHLNEAYLLQALERQDLFKVLHPSIKFMDNSNDTELIVYFENGLIVDYRKAKNQSHNL